MNFDKCKIKGVTISIILDKSHLSDKNGRYNALLRFSKLKDRYLHPTGIKMTEEDFLRVCGLKTTQTSNKLYKQYYEPFCRWIEEGVKVAESLDEEGNLSIALIKYRMSGQVDIKEDSASFIKMWENYIQSLKDEGRFTTAESYQCALNNFDRIIGKSNVKGFKIGQNIIEQWCKGMDKGVGKDKVGKISETTKGIYLRACRIIWNLCQDAGYLKKEDYPFSNKKKDKVGIPTGATRKAEFLNVHKMTELYRVFVEKRYPEEWNQEYKVLAHYSLGLFLFQYLCNGMNMADVGHIKYDKFYFLNDGQAFKFNRQKTKRTSKDNSEVIAPIIEPIKEILTSLYECNTDKTTFCNAPKLGQCVFPDILKGDTTPEGIRARTKQENKNCANRVQRIVKEVLDWEEIEPTCTWCRHSFGTNLRDAGVSMDYIADSMGHSSKESVTEIYIARFPLEKRMINNSKLLCLEQTQTEADLQSLSKKELIKLLLNK